MGSVNLGRVRVVPRGVWNSGTSYTILDVVTDAGSSYMAVQNVPPGTALTNAAFWQVVAAKGADGDPGPAGPPGTTEWADLTGTPTTLAGYGITDAATAAQGALADTALQPGAGIDWADVTGKPTFATVATTGAYGDLSGRPTLGTAAAQNTAAFATAAQGALAATALQPGANIPWTDVTGKPTFFSGAYGDLTGVPSTFAPAAHNQAWSTITSRPTTLAGYGITDAQPAATVLTNTTAAFTTAQETKLAGIAVGATANAADAALLARANHTGTQIAGTISDFAEAVDDRVAALVVAGTNMTITYNDAANTLTFAAAGGGSGAAGGALSCLVPPSGEFVMTANGSGGATTTLTGAANRIDIYPFVPQADLVVDALGVNCTTAVAGALCKVVVYDALSNGRPGALLFESATADLSTVGNKVLTASITFERGKTYWLGIRHSATAALSAWPLQAAPDINGGATMVTTARKTVRRTVTFATAAPSVWNFVATEINASAATAIWLRMA